MPDDLALAWPTARPDDLSDRRSDAPSGAVDRLPDPGIACLAWPREAERRTALAVDGVPRLLFVEPGAEPPLLWDLDEDWVRVPATVEEVELRAGTLRSRVAPAEQRRVG